MNEHDPQLEAALTATFARRDREVGLVAGDLTDVRRRAARRRAKRRALTAVGSVAIVATGIGGLLAMGQIDRDGTARGAGGPATSMPSEGGSWYVCSGATTQDDGTTLYDWCELESPYGNPAWSCTGRLADPATDGDDRPRFESCTAVGEAYPVADVGVCVRATAAPTTAVAGLPADPVAAPTTWFAPLCQPQFTPPTVAPTCVPPTVVPTTTTTTTTTTPAVTVPPMATTTWVDFVCPTPMDPPASVPASSMPMILPTNPPDPAGPTTAPPCPGCPRVSTIEQTAIVVAGQSIASIAADYGLTMEQLANYNQWPEGVNHALLVGDAVKIPPDSLLPDDVCLHTLVAGDSPDRIAEAYGTTVDELRTLNGPDFPGQFLVGDDVLVPRGDRSC